VSADETDGWAPRPISLTDIVACFERFTRRGRPRIWLAGLPVGTAK